MYIVDLEKTEQLIICMALRTASVASDLSLLLESWETEGFKVIVPAPGNVEYQTTFANQHDPDWAFPEELCLVTGPLLHGWASSTVSAPPYKRWWNTWVCRKDGAPKT